VETGSHDDPRPFIVETDEGSMRALGTKFLVKRKDDGTLLSVLQSAVAAHPQAADTEMILREGQQMLIQRHSLGPMLALAPGTDAWMRGMLVVDNAPLKDVIAELARYRQGHLGVAPEVADLRITGSFPLKDTDLALKALMPTLPVEIEQRTHWWVTVVASTARPSSKL
jgi:transmembrane sensor